MDQGRGLPLSKAGGVREKIKRVVGSYNLDEPGRMQSVVETQRMEPQEQKEHLLRCERSLQFPPSDCPAYEDTTLAMETACVAPSPIWGSFWSKKETFSFLMGIILSFSQKEGGEMT